MIDSHCHLADKKFEKDLPEVLARAKAAGISTMVTIADSLEESKRCIEIAEKYDDVFCTIGVHPHNAKDWNSESATALRSLATASKKIKGLGEIGLDYHYNFSVKESQLTAFEEQLRIAHELELPIVIHCREAIDDLKNVLKKTGAKNFVMHCCSEKWNDVEELVNQGCFLSFTGIATYPDAHDIRDTIKNCPLSQMMIETDAPYLAPVPHRGKRNEPTFVKEVAKIIAEIKGVSLEEVDRVTTESAIQFFGLYVPS